MKHTTINFIDPKLAAQVRAQAIERAKAAAKPTTSKPKARPAAPADVSRVMSNFAHLLQARAPEPPAAGSGTRRPALTREQSAQLAREIVAVNNRRLGITQDTDHAQARAQAEANMTPTAKQIVAIAKRVGLA